MSKNLIYFAYLFAVLYSGLAFAQTKQTAQVDVLMVDAKNRPRKNELVYFNAAHTHVSVSGRTNKDGKFSIKLPAGDDYLVLIQAPIDSAEYTTLAIPALKENEVFQAPFKVNIVYEPARSFTLDNVHFDVGKATLRPDSFKELMELAEYLKWRTDEQFEISGHTDNTGKPADNLRLSQQRSEAVRAYILKKGIPANRLIAKGYGDTQPVADNTTSEGKQQNRRTEVRLITKEN